MEDFERRERRERDKQARAMMTQEKHQEPVPLFGEPVRVRLISICWFANLIRRTSFIPFQSEVKSQ